MFQQKYPKRENEIPCISFSLLTSNTLAEDGHNSVQSENHWTNLDRKFGTVNSKTQFDSVRLRYLNFWFIRFGFVFDRKYSEEQNQTNIPQM